MSTFTNTFSRCLVQQGTNLSYPLILKDGNTVAWYDSTDLSTITKDGSNIVSRVNDKLKSGHDLVEGACSLGEYGFTFNGINQYMKALTFPLVQPTVIYLVLRDIGHTGRIVDGNTNAGGLVAFGAGTYITATSAGATLSEYGLTKWSIIRATFNAANSLIKINEIKTITGAGNAGTRSMNGITFSRYNEGNTAFGSFAFKEAIFRKSADSEIDQAIIYNYLKKKYGFKTYLLIGDSNTGQSPQWGEYIDIDWVGGGFPLIVNKSKVGSRIVNVDSNDTSHPYMAKRILDGSFCQADNIIVSHGTNDGDYSNPQIRIQYKANLLQLLSDHPGAKLYCMSIFPQVTLPNTARNANNVVLQQVVSEISGATWWDTETWVDRSTDFIDDVHINSLGQHKIATQVRARLNV